MMRSVQDVPFSIAERGPTGISGTGNFVLQIHRRERRPCRRQPSRRHPSFEIQNAAYEDGSELDTEDLENYGKDDARFSLYFLDSGAYSFNLAYPGYDWIKEDQVEWFRQTSQAITSRYPKDKVPNALAFFHIPLPEYGFIDDDDDNNGGNDGDEGEEGEYLRKANSKMVGDKVEGVSSPSYNSGMFDAILESKDVRATTAGHDHLNDYVSSSKLLFKGTSTHVLVCVLKGFCIHISNLNYILHNNSAWIIVVSNCALAEVSDTGHTVVDRSTDDHAFSRFSKMETESIPGNVWTMMN
jgi:hypothetical protein